MLKINVVGQTVTENDGVRRGSRELGGIKPRQLLQMLALEPGTPRSKDVLADQLWEGRPPDSWLATIESYMCVLRRRLGVERGRGSALATTSSGYVLDPEQVEVDLVRIRSLLASPELGDIITAVDLLDRELLIEEPYAPWACSAREALGELVADAGTRAARQANQLGQHDVAARLARTAVSHSYYSEPAWRELMQALWQSHGRSEAVRAFEQLRLGMRTELGLEPGTATHALYLEILHAGSSGAGTTTCAEEIDMLLHQLRRALKHTPSARLSGPTVQELGQLLLAHAG